MRLLRRKRPRKTGLFLVQLDEMRDSINTVDVNSKVHDGKKVH